MHACIQKTDDIFKLKITMINNRLQNTGGSTGIYTTAQFKLDRTCVQHGLNTRHFSFYTRASMHVHARLMTPNLPCITLVYALDVCTMYACMSGMHMPNLDYACMQIVSQGQWNKLYKHVHILRCNPLMIQDINPAK